MKKIILLLMLLPLLGLAQQNNTTNTNFTNGLASSKFFNIPRGTAPPTTGILAGSLFFHTIDGLQYYDGSVWKTVAAAGTGVTSFNSRTGAVTPQSGDYSSFYVPLARTLSTGYGLSGGGDLSVNRTLVADTTSADGLVSKSRLATNLGGYVPGSRTITINGTAQDLSANRTYSVGTVTSVGTGYGLLGGAITSSGTLSVDTSAIATKSYTNKYVPYDNATKNVNLGEFGIRAGYALLDTTPTNTPTTRGTIYWDTTRSTAALIMNGTTQEIGQDSYFYVKNSTGSPIAKGTAVRFAGTDGGSGHLLIAPFLANGTYPSSYFMGVTAEAIANGGFGQVMNFGELKGVNTNAYVDGDLLYASTSSAGGFQTTAPVAPNNIVLIAAVVNAANNGTIIVRPTYGSNINDDEGVKITNPLAGDVLQYKSSGLWENEPLDSAGIVPTSRTITINGTTQNLSANRTWNVGTVTSVSATAGTGISVSGSPITSSGNITITNTAPDQTVVLTAGTGISTSGTYPNFTITNTSPSPSGLQDSLNTRVKKSGDTMTGTLNGTDIILSDNLQADTVKGTAAIFNSSSKTLQVQFSGANVLSVNSTLAGASAPGGVYVNTLISGATQLSNLTVTNLNAGGLVKAVSPSGLFNIATPGTDYLAPGTAVLLTGNQSIAGNKTFTDDVNITGTDGTPSLTVTASGSVSRAISASTSGSSSIAIIADGTSGASGVVASAGNGAYGVQGNNTGSGWGGGFTSVSGPAIAAVSTSGVGGTFQSGSANIAEFYGSGATLNATVAQSGSISSTPQGTLYGTATGSITSSQLATSLTNETGTGNAVFSASPTFTGTIAAAALTLTGNLIGTTASLVNTTTFTKANNSSAGVMIGDFTSASGSSLFVKTGSLNNNYASGLAIYGTYSGGNSTINLYGVGTNIAGGYASSMNILLDNNGTTRTHVSYFNDGSTNFYGKTQILNTTGGTTPSNYLQITGSTSDNSNYPGIEFKGGTLSTAAYPLITLGNGGLALVLSSGYGSSSNTARNTISLNSATGIEFSTSTTGATTTRLTIASSGASTFTSSVTATSFFESSDLRLKNILSRSSSSGFDMVKFKWNPELNRDNKIHYGYVAQEVEKVYPDQVQTDSKGFKSVNYIEVLVKKVHDLEQRIKQLEK